MNFVTFVLEKVTLYIEYNMNLYPHLPSLFSDFGEFSRILL